jgi:hypothetical protein
MGLMPNPQAVPSIDPTRRPLRRQYVEDNQFTVAGIVAGVFKVAAFVAIAVGLYLFFWVRNHSDTATSSWRVQVAVAAGTVLMASMFAFFAYVLDLLRALVLDSRRK